MKNHTAIAITAGRDAKIRTIRANADAVRELPQGSRRQRATDELTSGLMTRCRRLTTHSLARDYFHVR